MEIPSLELPSLEDSFLADPSQFWHNATAVRIVALLAVGLLVTTIWLFRRKERSGHGAAIVCLVVSIGLHVAIIAFVPRLSLFFSGTAEGEPTDSAGMESIDVAVFAPEMDESSVATDDAVAEMLSPVPDGESPDFVTSIEPLALPQSIASLSVPIVETKAVAEPTPEPINIPEPKVPSVLASAKVSSADHATTLDDMLGDWLEETLSSEEPEEQPEVVVDQDVDSSTNPASMDVAEQPTAPQRETVRQEMPRAATTQHMAAANQGVPIESTHAEEIDEDFASRIGTAKFAALRASGGNADTEAAVKTALQYLVKHQREDGAWDPAQSGAGQERAPLGLSRGSAGKRAETGLTGLALLSLLGAGHTHQFGDYQDNVYRGLAFLLGKQRADGSLAGDASIYAAHYCHAMAALAVAEAAAMTGDEAAMEATRRAVAYSRSTQHPTTGGWRYTRGDKGDMSQLGWQAMLIDAAVRSEAITPPHSMQRGVARFLDSVSSGSAGGYACYRPGERATVTMTAEALAIRLLTGQHVSAARVREAEAVLLNSLPGKTAGPDNYYQWYYATMALHQLQDDAWHRWNASLQQRLLSTQQRDGSWPDSTLWGGYGGTVYSTSMATLCLEAHYRHTER
ncbi:Prenyltransferase and squalene oxidase repeat-containing protein [Neorhodopirellula lusitana]|uniref:Prenyltransferase and squalene oxidase repeat-containing protein n=1 Tax=Neorhodopirellula lusitana TaxID=445327 RepID=A0ABY1Q1F4_9BACT|nr:prenyltransferase/squalene oxidase repeat-containing protein [Neorhodopirellula lusitana]SMP52998.1 Prenyltransferase and squalene oxidase repeat-containing protein [Neorhodopirellula lusitana]